MEQTGYQESRRKYSEGNFSVLQERRTSFLRRSVKAFLRVHHLNKNLKTAVGVSQTEQEESLPAERMGMCDGGKHSVCRALSKPEQQEG